MAIWDVHHHWINEAGYIKRLLREMDRLGIERTGLIGMGEVTREIFVAHGRPVGCADNRQVAKLIEQRPDRFWGYGYLRPGHCRPDDVDQIVEMGLTALKFHLPLKPYGDPEYFEIYARAAARKLPCLFHTGVVGLGKPMPGEGIRSENYRPIHLEPIAHEFPDLSLIAAHLGVCWAEEAATLCRMVPNIYADLSGSLSGWRAGKSPQWWREMLYWPEAHEKIVFGSDVHADELEQTIESQRQVLAALGLNQDQAEDFFRDNARRIFGGQGDG